MGSEFFFYSFFRTLSNNFFVCLFVCENTNLNAKKNSNAVNKFVNSRSV